MKKYVEFCKNRKKNQSMINLTNKIGTSGIILMLMKIYLSVLINLPKMLEKRYTIQNNKKISKKEYQELLKNFSKWNEVK